MWTIQVIHGTNQFKNRYIFNVLAIILPSDVFQLRFTITKKSKEYKAPTSKQINVHRGCPLTFNGLCSYVDQV